MVSVYFLFLLYILSSPMLCFSCLLFLSLVLFFFFVYFFFLVYLSSLPIRLPCLSVLSLFSSVYSDILSPFTVFSPIFFHSLSLQYVCTICISLVIFWRFFLLAVIFPTICHPFNIFLLPIWFFPRLLFLILSVFSAPASPSIILPRINRDRFMYQQH